jgi:O-antigen/teichoic acid export membrane protein
MPDIPAPGLERLRRLSKEGAWVVLGQAAAVLGSLAGVRLLTELLDPAAYGELALGMTVASLVNQALLGPLGNGITRFYAPAQEGGDLGGYLGAARGLVLASTAVIALAILLAGAGLLLTARAQWIGIATAALVFATVSGCNAILSGIQNAARQRAIVALHQGVEPWARFLLAAAMLLWLGATSTVAMLGYVLAVALVLGSQYLFFRKVMRDDSAVADMDGWRRQIWHYSWPISIFGAFTWMQLASDRWALELFATTQDVGLYAALFQLGYYPMSIATGMAVQFLVPIFFQRAGDASDDRRNADVDSLSWRLTGIALALTGTVFLAALLLHAQIFRVFAAAEYASVSHLLPWMLLSGGIFAAGQTIALNLMSQMKTRAMIAPKLITALLGVALNFACARWYGISGIVVAGLVFSTTYFLWMAMLSRHEGANLLLPETGNEP